MTSKMTDRIRPDEAPGAKLDGFSLPQHDVKSDNEAVQQQKAALDARQPIMDPYKRKKGNETRFLTFIARDSIDPLRSERTIALSRGERKNAKASQSALCNVQSHDG
jgi:hypothetical protein